VLLVAWWWAVGCSASPSFLSRTLRPGAETLGLENINKHLAEGRRQAGGGGIFGRLFCDNTVMDLATQMPDAV
jgi:hypothetical protein